MRNPSWERLCLPRDRHTHRSTHRSPCVCLGSGPFLPAWSITLFGSRQDVAVRMLLGRQPWPLPREAVRTPRSPPACSLRSAQPAFPLDSARGPSVSLPCSEASLSITDGLFLPQERGLGESLGASQWPRCVFMVVGSRQDLCGHEDGTVSKEIRGRTQTSLSI